ncbi:MAG: 2-epi-5-epi-valiolone epimerase [Streptomyces sp.]|jgi:catechol 2,3-dioxygenase-like lactoylglutathione lyase family enzyme|nr:2-epi-5-epi-valiolone epimerase [Streptomyces sp.]MDX6348401.1 2-epi-5-epi-valiolone epimerase [Streptomyces sp.]
MAGPEHVVVHQVAAGIPTARRVDHLAFTVTDLEEAVGFFEEVLDGRLCYVEGPIEHRDDDWMWRKLGVHPRASVRVAMVRLGALGNIELFQYTAPGQRTVPPAAHDPGGHRLVVEVEDLDAVTAYVRARPGARLTGGAPDAGAAWVDFDSPWGLRFRLRRAPGGPAVAGLSLTVADLGASVRFMTRVLGAEPLSGDGDPSALLRLGPTDTVELRQSPGGRSASPPPRNSDVGGHHLAFYVDDVDAAVRYLAAQPGITVMGEPETITDGPLAGNRWVYFRTPIGIQMEVLRMPDGALPYERTTTARRAPAHPYRWTDRP